MVSEVIKENRKCRSFINSGKIMMVVLAFVLYLALPCFPSAASSQLVQEAKEAIESVDAFMGDWQGTFTSRGKDKAESPMVAQVIVLGKGRYHANLLAKFDTRDEPIATLEGQQEGSKIIFAGWGDHSGDWRGPDWYGVLEDGKFTGSVPGRKGGSFVMHKVFRPSPRLGQKPPAGAVVLFDGTNFDQWMHADKTYDGDLVKWKLVNEAMEAVRGIDSIKTKKKFKDFQLHVEFRTPFMPDAREQLRGNSGVYIEEYGFEVQILDSYGLKGLDNECGGIYKIAKPIVNMCAPPMQWQSCDITFHEPPFDDTGQKISSARITVLHNDVKVHDNVELPKAKGGGSIYLQAHGKYGNIADPVQFRNIWLVEL